MIQTTIPCRHCGEPTIEIEFSRHWRRVCNNVGCRLFRERQGIIPREDNELQENSKKLSSAQVLTWKYQASLTRGKENYHFARSLHIPSVIARGLRNKSKKEIERAAKERVTV